MLVVKAIQFASEKHKGQTRKCSGLPYVTHPIIVMELVQKYKGTSKHLEELKCAALLHDVLEDTDGTYHEIEREFNPLIASIVMELTSDPEGIKEFGKAKYIYQKMLKMSQYAFTLKLLDRMSNIMDRPTEKYVQTTNELMKKLLKNRGDITKRQRGIIENIISICDKFQEKED